VTDLQNSTLALGLHCTIFEVNANIAVTYEHQTNRGLEYADLLALLSKTCLLSEDKK